LALGLRRSLRTRRATAGTEAGPQKLTAPMPGKIVLETNLPSPGPVVRANVDQLRQVLTNLLTNAWEAIGEGGRG